MGGNAFLHEGSASKTSKTITVINKIDLAQPDLSRWPQGTLLVSVKTGHGLDALRTALVRFAGESFGGIETPLITRARHREQIEHARSALNQFLVSAEASEHPEIAAEHLRAAADALGRLTGRLDVEDVLGQISGILHREVGAAAPMFHMKRSAWLQSRFPIIRHVGDNRADTKAEVKMRCLGLLGGMSWESTAIYCRLLNEGVRSRLGGLHSAPFLLWSTDFALIADWQVANEWEALGQQLSEAGHRLVCAGAEAF